MIIDSVRGNVRFAYNKDRSKLPEGAMKVEMYLSNDGIFYVVPHEEELKKSAIDKVSNALSMFNNLGINYNEAVALFNTYSKISGDSCYNVNRGIDKELKVEMEEPQSISKIEFD
jgi:hypothetical protein